MRLSRHLAALASGILLYLAGPLAVHAQSAEDVESGKVCAQCHEGTQHAFSGKHGVRGDPRTPAANGGCASCHGDVSEHLKDPTKAKPKYLGKSAPQEERNAVCTNCHQGQAQIHWQGSTHDRARVACADCHKPHAAKDQVLVTQTQAGVCFDCHKDVRAAVFRFSSHPLRTGWMSCSSCHAPHGSVSEHQMVKNTVNETCYTCHADKRGPFLWEHPPARENCGECHSPHGSNNAPLLKARGPYLCQQCHINPFHPSTLYSGADLPGSPGYTPGGRAGDKMLGQNCMNCHPKVHGSNHPSGARFTR